MDGAEGQAQELRAACRGRGFILGSTSQFQAITNESLQATLIDTRLGNEERVLLISIQDDGQPLLEDLTGQLAMEAGRGPMSKLDGLEINLDRFVTAGEVRVRPAVQNLAGRSGTVNIRQQIAAERARRGIRSQS